MRCCENAMFVGDLSGSFFHKLLVELNIVTLGTFNFKGSISGSEKNHQVKLYTHLNDKLVTKNNQVKLYTHLNDKMVNKQYNDLFTKKHTFQRLCGLVAGPQQCSSVNGAVTPLDWN